MRKPCISPMLKGSVEGGCTAHATTVRILPAEISKAKRTIRLHCLVYHANVNML